MNAGTWTCQDSDCCPVQEQEMSRAEGGWGGLCVNCNQEKVPFSEWFAITYGEENRRLLNTLPLTVRELFRRHIKQFHPEAFPSAHSWESYDVSEYDTEGETALFTCNILVALDFSGRKSFKDPFYLQLLNLYTTDIDYAQADMFVCDEMDIGPQN